jgi:hypothetical protein
MVIMDYAMTVSSLVTLVIAVITVLHVKMISIYIRVCVIRIALMELSKTMSGIHVKIVIIHALVAMEKVRINVLSVQKLLL